ncbi:hopanoid biosynthesis associated protein HpnK [Faunimonas pinastri]|uniref:Hopanoid biosynthesis associated protein HpnK n=1 Tax=Faunimonas pinastri TaxID=1855383 RepID=A0A1H9AHV2_9HYPH|nr:hopanoid biosynthesis associated protein HpnK [Faunimonas pinastri]
MEIAHRRGILTAASLMVGAPAFADAVERARAMPGLGVGLHLTLVDGAPVLPPRDIPDLVGSDGRFSTDPVKMGVGLFFRAAMKRQAEAEIRAQFERFRQTGLSLDHVNAHQHFHMHPTVRDLVLRIGRDYGMRALRIPAEPFRVSWRAAGDRPFGRALNRVFHANRNRAMRGRAAGAGMRLNDRVFGFNDTGAMVEARWLALLPRLPDGVTEIYCHPATRRWTGADNLPGHYRPVEEFQALVSAEVRRAVELCGARLAPFAALPFGQAGVAR